MNNIDISFSCAYTNEKFLVSALAADIRAYRHHFLFVPNTMYHREISKFLQDQMDVFEQASRVDRFSGNSDHLVSRQEGTEARRMSFMRDSITPLNKDSALLSKVHGDVNQFLPDRYGFWWNLYRFHTADKKEIFEELSKSDIFSIVAMRAFLTQFDVVQTGVLDCSLPNVMYTIAAKTFTQSLDVYTTWVAIGTVGDLAVAIADFAQ